MKDWCQKWKVKLILRGPWNSLMAWPDWFWSPIFYHSSTPLATAIPRQLKALSVSGSPSTRSSEIDSRPQKPWNAGRPDDDGSEYNEMLLVDLPMPPPPLLRGDFWWLPTSRLIISDPSGGRTETPWIACIDIRQTFDVSWLSCTRRRRALLSDCSFDVDSHSRLNRGRTIW